MYHLDMMNTMPPIPQELDPDAQFARIESAKTYLMAALELLVEHQEHEVLTGNLKGSSEVARLRELARDVQDTTEDYLGVCLLLCPIDELQDRVDAAWAKT